MASTMKLHSRIRLEADAEGKGGMLFDTRTAAICACNESAWLIARGLKKSASAEALADMLSGLFEVERGHAIRDVLALVTELRALNMLESD